MRMLLSSGDVDTHLVRASPLRCMTRGPRVPLDCCCEHVGLFPGRGPSGRRRPSSGRGVVGMEVLFERVAGLDVGKATLTVCVRTPSPDGRRRVVETRTFSTMTGSEIPPRPWRHQ